MSLDKKPPCLAEIVKSYPIRYVAPQFQKFDGRQRITWEHVVCFLTSWEHVLMIKIYAWESSRMLTNCTYTWYLNLKSRFVHDSEHLGALFNTKVFFLEAKFTFRELGQTRQYPGEGLDVYIKHFHEKALDYYDTVLKDVLVDVCFHGMIEDYQVYIANLSFLFSRLMEAAKAS